MIHARSSNFLRQTSADLGTERLERLAPVHLRPLVHAARVALEEGRLTDAARVYVFLREHAGASRFATAAQSVGEAALLRGELAAAAEIFGVLAERTGDGYFVDRWLEVQEAIHTRATVVAPRAAV